MLAIKFLILVLAIIIAFSLGWFLTEPRMFRIADKWEMFNVKPFTCRKCLSFHIAWVITTFFSLALGDWIMLLVGLFFSIMLFIGLYLDEKSKIVNLEDFKDDNDK